MYKIIYNINAYVEEDSRYMSDNVLLTLNETTFEVIAISCDEDGVALVKASPIVDNISADLPTAILYYEKIDEQLAENDVIRNIQ